MHSIASQMQIVFLKNPGLLLTCYTRMMWALRSKMFDFSIYRGKVGVVSADVG